jgi:hypothetical protein
MLGITSPVQQSVNDLGICGSSRRQDQSCKVLHIDDSDMQSPKSVIRITDRVKRGEIALLADLSTCLAVKAVSLPPLSFQLQIVLRRALGARDAQ